jgi:hypothetical protein
MITKLDLYIELLNALHTLEIDYEQDDKSHMVTIQDGSDHWKTVEVYLDRYIGGTIEFDNSNNFYRYENTTWQDSTDLDEAIGWLK